MSPSPPLHLLTLPPELRHQIYTHTYPSFNIYMPDTERNVPHQPRPIPWRSQRRLLYVNRQIYNEVRNHIYRHLGLVLQLYPNEQCSGCDQEHRANGECDYPWTKSQISAWIELDRAQSGFFERPPKIVLQQLSRVRLHWLVDPYVEHPPAAKVVDVLCEEARDARRLMPGVRTLALLLVPGDVIVGGGLAPFFTLLEDWGALQMLTLEPYKRREKSDMAAAERVRGHQEQMEELLPGPWAELNTRRRQQGFGKLRLRVLYERTDHDPYWCREY